MKLKKGWAKNNSRTRYNVEFLKDKKTTEEFRLTLANRYQALQDLQEDGSLDLYKEWQQEREAWTTTCEEAIGKKKTQQNEWTSAETLTKVQKRKELKEALNNSRTRETKEPVAAGSEAPRVTFSTTCGFSIAGFLVPGLAAGSGNFAERASMAFARCGP
ncbi:hypothetical protein AAFF_G00352170 [Aldrovandia affinis]|uniref:Uncharacterized protein n=1 Tax=Aldrovandia affinis TaxID=143900 RepID=A0AAD7SIU8_9TELE|nr:hypothetical protein AAFF_G00352170 [Aldrovandia affinis]